MIPTLLHVNHFCKSENTANSVSVVATQVAVYYGVSWPPICYKPVLTNLRYFTVLDDIVVLSKMKFLTSLCNFVLRRLKQLYSFTVRFYVCIFWSRVLCISTFLQSQRARGCSVCYSQKLNSGLLGLLSYFKCQGRWLEPRTSGLHDQCFNALIIKQRQK